MIEMKTNSQRRNSTDGIHKAVWEDVKGELLDKVVSGTEHDRLVEAAENQVRLERFQRSRRFGNYKPSL